MATTILARRGASTSVPTLDVGELGWLTDLKVAVLGDGTSTPPRIMTSKTTALMDYTAALGLKLKTVHALKTDSSLTAVSVVLPATDDATNTGIYSPAVNQVGIAAGGVSVFRASNAQVTLGVNTVIAATGYLKVARGNTAQRAASDTPGGEIRFNTEVGTFGSLEVLGTNGAWFTVYTSGQPNGYGVAGGTANAITVTLDSAPVAYTNGMEARVRLTAGNTGAATLNVNGIGAKAVVLPDGTALVGGETVAGMIARYLYDPALDAFQLTNALAVASSGSGSSGGSTDEAPLTVKFTTRAAVQAGDVALLFADGTIAPATVTNRDSLVNPLHQARDWRYKNVRTLWTPDNLGADSLLNSSYIAPQPVHGTPLAQLTNGKFVVFSSPYNSNYPQLTLYSVAGDVLKNIILENAPLYNSTSNGTQVHVVALSGGGFAASWAIWSNNLPNASLRCRYAVFDADGNQVVGPTDVGSVATTTTAYSGFGQRVVRMVALTGGGFGIFYTYAHEASSSTARTMLACTYNAAGVQQGSTLTLATHPNTISGPTFGVTGGAGPVHDDFTSITALPNGNWAVCWLTYASSVYTINHATITAAGALAGTVNQFANGLLSSTTAFTLRTCADRSDGSWYIAFGTQATNQAVVLAKISATNTYVSKKDLAAYSSEIVTYAIVSKTGGGVVMFATRAYSSSNSPATPFIPNSIYINAITFNASLVQQSSKVIADSMPDPIAPGSNYNPRLYAWIRADGSYLVLRYGGVNNGFFGYYCFVDQSFDAKKLLNFQYAASIGLETKLTYPMALPPGEFFAHPDSDSVKVMPVICYGDSSYSGNINIFGVQLIADTLEARTIVGVVQADKAVGQQADVTIRGPVTTRLNFGSGFTFNYRGASDKFVGNTGWFASNKGMLGGPQKAGVENKRPITVSLDTYRSYRVPRGYRLEAQHYAGAGAAQIAVNGIYLPDLAGSLLYAIDIVASEGDVISSSNQLTVTGYLISA